MGIMADHRKAQEVAKEIASSFGVEDIETLLVDQINDDERRRFMTEIDEEYYALEKEATAILDRLKTSVESKTNLDDINRFADIEYSRRSVDAIAGFHLGFAAALRLLGRKS